MRGHDICEFPLSIDSQILAELVQIRWLLVAIFLAMFLAILFFVVTVAMRVRQANTTALLQIRDNLLAEIALLEVKGKYEEMVEKSGTALASYPNDLMANWYSAIANHQTGNYGAALSALGKIKEINSVWSADAVDEFIAEIRAEMGGPRSGDP